jgi:hypothetical protein
MGDEGKSGVPVGLANTAEAIRGGKEGVTTGLTSDATTAAV